MSLYLDYNAAAPLRPESRQAMLESLDRVGNASSVHQYGRRIRQKIDQCRQELADYFATDPASVIFTSGATEANHLALCGFRGRIIVSAVEHDSVDRARPDRHVCPVTGQGCIDLKSLEAQLQALMQEKEEPVMVSVMAANNETGVIQPLDDVSVLARKYGAFLHCDAVQAVGRIGVNWQNIDLISASAHKVGGPQGVGALVNRTSVPLEAQLRGGGQERSFRAGTENLAGIAGFAAAIQAVRKADWLPVQNLRNALEAGLADRCPDLIVVARDVPRLPNTTVLVMEGVKSATQVIHFDLAGLALSAGSACSSGKVRPSRVLEAMGIPAHLADCSIRVSLGLESPALLVDRFIDTWAAIRDRAHA